MQWKQCSSLSSVSSVRSVSSETRLYSDATIISDGRFKKEHIQQKWNNILVAASIIVKPNKVVPAEWGGDCVAFEKM